MNDRHYLNAEDHQILTELVNKHGLRPMVDAVGCAARELVDRGCPVKDEYGEEMDVDDVETASNALTQDLY